MRLRGEELDTAYFATLRAGEGRPNTRPGAAAAGRVGRGPEAPEARGARNHRGVPRREALDKLPRRNLSPASPCRQRRRQAAADPAGRLHGRGDLARRCWAGLCSTGGPGPTTAGSAAPSLASARLPAGRLLAQSGLHSADVRVLRGRCSTPSLTAQGPQGASPAPAAGMDSGPLVKRSRRMSRPRLPVSSICGRKSLQTYICL